MESDHGSADPIPDPLELELSLAYIWKLPEITVPASPFAAPATPVASFPGGYSSSPSPFQEDEVDTPDLTCPCAASVQLLQVKLCNL